MNQILKFAAAALVAGGLLIPSAACTLNPTVTAFNESNQCGGTIVVSGQGFSPNQTVDIEVLGFWEHGGWEDLGTVHTDGNGNFSGFRWGFEYQPFSTEPGCAFGASHSNNSVTVMGKDITTGSVTFTTAATAQCPIYPGSCPA
jgi:hypothetical protein